MSHPSGPSDPATLPRVLGEFLIELSLTLNRAAMYPKGHPSLERSAGALAGRLSQLLAERPTLSLGVAKRQLVVEGIASEGGNPVLQSLAARLHRLHIGAVVFQRGASAGELMDVVHLLSAEEERGATPLGMREPERLRSWENIRLYPLAYDQLELVDEDGEEREASKAAQLWVGLARAALAGDADDVTAARTSTEPGAVAQAINDHAAAVAYDQVIVGFMLQIAGELRQTGDAAGSAALKRRVSRLVSELSDDVLRRLVAMGGDSGQRRRFLLDASDGFAGAAVVELVRAAADASQQTVSHSMLRILTKLGGLADEGAGVVRVEAESALREQVRALVGDWHLQDPNPEAYTAALESMARSTAAPPADAPDMGAEPIRLLEMLIELDAESPHTDALVDGALDSGAAGRLLDLLEAAGPDQDSVNTLWRVLVEPERLGRWIRSGHADLAALDRLMTRAPPAAIAGPLLDALAAEEQRETRLGLLRRAGALGQAVAGEANARLADERWYVRRNMLQLLREAALAPAGGALPFARDEHPLVRAEAMRLALLLPEERERALALGLREGADELLALAMASARENLPAALVPALAARTADEALEPAVRVQLIELLGSTRSALAAEPLLRLVVRGRNLFGRLRLAPSSPVVIAALRALAALPAPTRRVRDVLDRAQRSSAPEIRAAVSA